MNKLSKRKAIVLSDTLIHLQFVALNMCYYFNPHFVFFYLKYFLLLHFFVLFSMDCAAIMFSLYNRNWFSTYDVWWIYKIRHTPWFHHLKSNLKSSFHWIFIFLFYNYWMAYTRILAILYKMRTFKPLRNVPHLENYLNIWTCRLTT